MGAVCLSQVLEEAPSLVTLSMRGKTLEKVSGAFF